MSLPKETNVVARIAASSPGTLSPLEAIAFWSQGSVLQPAKRMMGKELSNLINAKWKILWAVRLEGSRTVGEGAAVEFLAC